MILLELQLCNRLTHCNQPLANANGFADLEKC